MDGPASFRAKASASPLAPCSSFLMTWFTMHATLSSMLVFSLADVANHEMNPF